MSGWSADRVIDVLQQPAKARSHRELDVVLSLLLCNPFFQRKAREVSNELPRQCARSMTHEHVQSLEAVYRAGEQSLKMYVVIRGSVQITVGESSKVVKPGECFGESALETNYRREDSVVAEVNCDFAVMHKTEYLDIVEKLDQKRLHDLVTFLHSIPTFARMSRGAIHRLTAYLHPRTYLRKQYLYRSGNPSDEVFIVREGELALTQDIHSKKASSPIESLSSYRGGKVIRHHANIALVGPGEFVGDTDVVERRKRTQTCTCNSAQATVLAVSKGVRGQVGLSANFRK